MPQKAPLLRRFLTKLFVDVLPAAMASAIGGFVLTHYQVLTQAIAPAPVAEQHATASAEMMKLVRDEHGQIADFLNAQFEAEKTRLAAEQKASAHSVTESHPAAPAVAAHRVMVAMVVAKPAAPHEPSPAAAAASSARAPAAITPVQANESAEPPHDSDSVLAKTMRIKETVVTATQRAGAVIGSIPSWIAGVGDRIGGQSATPPSPPARLVSAAW
jgi:hypothetical protein